jgi:hypothetical protein
LGEVREFCWLLSRLIIAGLIACALSMARNEVSAFARSTSRTSAVLRMPTLGMSVLKWSVQNSTIRSNSCRFE